MSQQLTFFFKINKSVVGETYQEGNQKYLVAILPITNIFCPNGAFSHLVVPDDNSMVANSVRTNSTNDYFITPFSNLKFRPDLFTGKAIPGSNVGWEIKETSQVEKYSQTEPSLTEIAFKVINQKKVIKKDYAEGCYCHELEIEPLSLGIEGMPEISTIAFEFFSAPPEAIPVAKPLFETKLYNSKLLAESEGKNFTIKVRFWSMSIRDNYKRLGFHTVRDFDLDSFQEKSASNNQPPNPDQSEPTPPSQQNNNSAPPEKGNKGLIISGVITIFVVLALTIGFFIWVRKKKTKK